MYVIIRNLFIIIFRLHFHDFLVTVEGGPVVLEGAEGQPRVVVEEVVHRRQARVNN